ncbi:hypothetical protein Tco_0413239 [Tanacetum coccineum]
MENLYPKHGLISRTYSKKSLIMASIVGFKSKFSMIMSPFILSARLIAPLAANSAIRMPTNLGKLLRTLPSTTMKVGMKQKNSSNRPKPFLHRKASQKHLNRRTFSSSRPITSYKRSRPRPIVAHSQIPQAYVNVVYPNSRPQNQNEPPTLRTFTFRKRTCPNPQPQALNTTFEARVRDYMATHTERMERFENTVFEQHEEINGRMTEMFGLLKELTTSRTLEKVLIREEAKFHVTKNLNSISLTKGEEGGSNRTKVTPDNVEKPTETETETPVIEVEKINEVENRAKLIKTSENEESVEAPGFQPVAYYLKHKINEKLIKGQVNNNQFNNSQSRKPKLERKQKEKSIKYNPGWGGLLNDAIHKENDTKKEDNRGGISKYLGSLET